MSEQTKQAGWSDHDVDLMISNILRVGLTAATAVLILGTIIHIVTPEHAPQATWHTFAGEPAMLSTIPGIIEGTLHGNGLAIMELGVLLLLATPFLRVAFAAYAFGKQHDKVYVLISLAVLALLIYGVISGGAA